MMKIRFCDGNVLIEGLPLSNQRKISKLNIFLNGIQEIEFFLKEDSILISFISEDQFVNYEVINKIIAYIEKTFSCDIICDEFIQQSIETIHEYRENVDLIKQKANAIRNLNLSECKEFSEFCKFCDESLSLTLRPYQYKAAFYLTNSNGGFDFSVPGSGKTIISYATYNYFRHINKCDSILIIGPINSFNAWIDEYENCFNSEPDFENLALQKFHDVQNYLNTSQVYHKEITFINIDKVWRLTNELVSFVKSSNMLLIIDEGHKEKNPDAKITKAVLEITKYVSSRIILTGTPMPNGYEDLYSLMKIYSPYDKILPFSYNQLKFFSQKGATETDEDRLMASIKPYYSRVSKKYLLQTGELLPPIAHIVNIEMSPEQLQVYDFLDGFAANLDNDWESSFNLMLLKAVVIRKMQISANPGLLTESIFKSIDEYKKDYIEEYESSISKSEALIQADTYLSKAIFESEVASIIKKFHSGSLSSPKNNKAIELAISLVRAGEKVILWDTFVNNMDILKSEIQNQLGGIVAVINGSVVGDERQCVLQNFKNGDIMVLIANPATLAESISLHKVCQNAIYVNRNFNAAQFIQSKDRIHRINMPKGKTANYFYLLNENSVDIKINERLNLKEERMLRILDSKEPVIGGAEFENGSFVGLDDMIDSYRC